jgi:phosphomevalonate kinase
VLIAGGYLVLDPSHSGLVVATDDARMHVTLTSSPSNAETSKIRIISPQVDFDPYNAPSFSTRSGNTIFHIHWNQLSWQLLVLHRVTRTFNRLSG